MAIYWQFGTFWNLGKIGVTFLQVLTLSGAGFIFLVHNSRIDLLLLSNQAKIEDSKKCRPWDTCCVGSDGDVISLPDGCFCADYVPESQKRARK